MRKKNLAAKAVIAALAVSMILSGCGSSGYESVGMSKTEPAMAPSYMEEAAYDGEVYEMENSASADSWEMPAEDYDNGNGANTEKPEANSGRKLIRTMNMTVETRNYDDTVASVEKTVRELGGYIEQSNYWNGSYGDQDNRNASLTIRIPAQKLDSFVNLVAEHTNIVRRSESVEDVTLTYVDLESHKKSLQSEQKRLMELLEMAETMEDIISIEDKLADVRYRLDSMESQLRSYDNQIDYSTLYLDVLEVVELTLPEPEGFGERIADGFLESVDDVKDGIVDFAADVIIHLPQIAVWLIVIVILWRIFRRLRIVYHTICLKDREWSSRQMQKREEKKRRREEKRNAKKGIVSGACAHTGNATLGNTAAESMDTGSMQQNRGTEKQEEK